MTKADLELLERSLSEGVGLPVRAVSRPSPGGEVIELSPTEVDARHSFSVEVNVSWVSARSVAKPGVFAADFVELMGSADPISRLSFCLIAKSLSDKRLAVSLFINEAAHDPTNSQAWPDRWLSFTISVAGRPFPATDRDAVSLSEIRLVAHATLALISSLAAEATDDSAVLAAEEVVSGFPEGSVTRVGVNRYERDRRNRGLCLAVHGYVCQVCAFDFEAVYGEIGAGFIHVHHIVPVSQLGGGYVINPVHDLIPLCPNCHSMIHRTIPAMSVSELKEIVKTCRTAI